MDKKIKVQTNKHLNVNYKTDTPYQKILEYLREIDGNLKNYKDIKPNDKIEVFDRKEESRKIWVH